jgi:hypothetical protein
VGKLFRGLGKTIKFAVFAVFAIVAVIIVVAVVSVGGAVNKSDKSSKQVTPAKYAQITTGMSQTAVEQLLGKPETTNSTTIAGQTDNCIEYGVLAQSGTYQFCFSNGSLAEKSQF